MLLMGTEVILPKKVVGHPTSKVICRKLLLKHIGATMQNTLMG